MKLVASTRKQRPENSASKSNQHRGNDAAVGSKQNVIQKSKFASSAKLKFKAAISSVVATAKLVALGEDYGQFKDC